MSVPTRSRRRRLTGLALAAAVACALAPATAGAMAPVNLATALPFVVLAGSTATNTGPSVLNGDLGVSPGSALVGFGLPAVVNGATHTTDAVAAQAQLDVTTAYNVAAGEPVSPANDLTGTDLGNRVLKAGAYRFTSSAQLTGALTLDAEGDPGALCVFEIASTLTTASASSVVLLNGASPCNVYWQVGSSATLGTTTAFQGNLMALADISLNDGASVIGRLLARNGAVTLINNVLDNTRCNTGTGAGTTGKAGSAGAGANGTTGGTGGAAGTAGAAAAAAAAALKAQAKQTSSPRATVTRNGTTTFVRTAHATCTSGFRAAVHGRLIRSVAFSLDGKTIERQAKRPFAIFVRSLPGSHYVTARVTFRDATRARTLKLGYRACADAVLTPASGPSQFTG